MTEITLTYWQAIAIAFIVFFIGFDIAKRQQ